MATKENNLNSKVKDIMTSEVKFIIAVVVFLFGIITPYFTVKEDIALIQKDISNINANHEVHIQDILQNIKDIRERDSAQDEKLINLSEAIIRLSK